MDGSTLQTPQQKNHSTLLEFILIGFSDIPSLQEFLFGVFLIIYFIIVLSNCFIIIITRIDPSLQTPMYFFLGNFSFSEICYVSVIIPRLLTNLYRQDRSISITACATQMHLFLVLGVTECLILTVMAYDRYVTICNPLLYPLIMNNSFCIQLATGCWVFGVPVHIGFTYWIFSLLFCGSNQLNHFFLWCSSSSQPSLWGHFNSRDIDLCDCSFSGYNSFYVYSWILCKNNLNHSEVSICYWESQDLLYMFFPPYGCSFILWVRYHHVFETKVQLFSSNRQIPFSFLYSCDPTV